MSGKTPKSGTWTALPAALTPPKWQRLRSQPPNASAIAATNCANRSNELRENTEWHNIVAWRNSADVAEKFIRKGTQLYIEGKLRTRQWTDQTGAKRYTTEVVVDNMQLLGKRPDGTGAPAQASYQAPAQASQPAPAAPVEPIDISTDGPADDLPF